MDELDTPGRDRHQPVSGAKRIVLCIFLLLIVGAIGAFAAFASLTTSTQKEIPHPWGEIRLMHYSTNAAGTTMAHFRFRNLSNWAVFLDVGLEVNDGKKWEMGRGYLNFVEIEKPVPSRGGQTFAVPVPFGSKEWRVLARASRSEFSDSDLRREKVKQWLDSRGATFLSKKLEVDDPNGYVLAGPLMKWDKPGQLPVAYDGIPVRWPAWEPFPPRGARRR